MSAAAPGGRGMNGAGGAGPGRAGTRGRRSLGVPQPPAREAPRPGRRLPARGVRAGGRRALGARLNSGVRVISVGQCVSLSESALGGSRGGDSR